MVMHARLIFCLVEQGGYEVTNITAAYHASKVGGIVHVLNGNYPFASFTTRVLLLDLQRATKSSSFPLTRGFSQWKTNVAKAFPGYIKDAAKALRSTRLEVIPAQTWDLERISVHTFAHCIAGWNKGPNLLDALKAANITYMSQLSTWYMNVDNSTPIVHAISNRALHKIFSLPYDDKIQEVEEIEGFGELRTAVIKEMVREGTILLLTDNLAVTNIGVEMRRNDVWQQQKLAIFGARNAEQGRLYSDGSFKTKAAFAVVDSNQDLKAKSKIGGIQTPQRAELFGLLIASHLGPNCVIHTDPNNIINTIKRSITGDIKKHEWFKIANRSIIRNITHIATSADNYVWIRGHQDGEDTEEAICNNAVDVLAKEVEQNDSPALTAECWEFADDYMVLDQGLLFEGDVRKAVLQRTISNAKDLFLGDKKRIRYANCGWWTETPAKETLITYGAFRLKLYSKSLPTHDRLAKRFPGLYTDLVCPCCSNDQETDWHLFVECKAFLNDRMDAWEEIVECLGSKVPGGNTIILHNISNWLDFTGKDKDNPATFWFLGGIPTEALDLLKLHLSKEELVEVWQTVHARIMMLAHAIWKARCVENKNRGWVFDKLWNERMEDLMFQEYTQPVEADDYALWER